MEIYNENAYDLFEDRHLETSFDKWTKVKIILNRLHFTKMILGSLKLKICQFMK